MLTSLVQRPLRVQAYFCDSINFTEFVRILAPYSPKATPNDKLKALMAIWDVNGDGRVCKEDVAMVIREASGTNLMEGEVLRVVERVFEACEKRLGRRIGAEGLSVGEFEAVLAGWTSDLAWISVPSDCVTEGVSNRRIVYLSAHSHPSALKDDCSEGVETQ